MAKIEKNSSPWETNEVRKKQRDIKKEAVLLAAAKLFNKQGFHATSLEEVARSLNVTKPTIYHYFSNKDAILFECVKLGLRDIRAVAENAEQTKSTGIDKLQLLIQGYVKVISDEFGRSVALTSDKEMTEGSRMKFRELKRQIDEIIRRVIEAGMSDGSIAKGDVKLISFAIAGAVNGLAQWYNPEGELSVEQIAKNLAINLTTGIAPNINV